MNKLLLSALLLTLPAAAGAHEVWIERDGNGPARIYLAEPAQPLPPGGDPEFAKLRAPKLLGAEGAAMTRRAGFLEVAVPAGDVRAWDDNVFAPWGEAGKKEGVVYYARAGRQETTAKLPFEIVPVTAGGDRFTVMRDGRPMAETQVTVISPDKWTRVVTTGADGSFLAPMQGKGRYLLVANAKDEGANTLPGGPVAVTHHITTTSFVAG